MKFSTAFLTLLVALSAEANILARTFSGNKANTEFGEHAVISRARGNRRELRSPDDDNLMGVKDAYPTQTFYLPLPESDVFYNMFRQINYRQDSKKQYYVRGNMVSILSVAIGTNKTVMWYDHWEDGYEKDVSVEIRSSNTEVWGDGIAINGCRPDVPNCRDEDDFLDAGDSFVIESLIPVDPTPRTSSTWFTAGCKIDGGDRIQASYPITITRGEYAEYPGSLLAGSVEVHDTSRWGTDFEAPVGTNTVISTSAFEYTRLFVMSGTNDNSITLPDGTNKTIGQGESISFSVKAGDKIKSAYPVQVDICAGDIDSTYELRWWSLLSNDFWSTEYLSPVGDTFARTKVILYNPHASPIQVQLTTLDSTGKEELVTYTVPNKNNLFTKVIPTGSGALVKSDRSFIAFSMTDTEMYTDKIGGGTEMLGGMAFEWGCALMPTNQLTPQVLVGWGHGCTGNNCMGKTERSAVWITPMEDANVYVDYENRGDPKQYGIFPVKKLQSIRIRDHNDTDMSGAIIFATKMSENTHTGTPVNIASAWGQDPSVSRDLQSISLDLGTTVTPFPTVRVEAQVDKAVASPGDELLYTISIYNVGQVDVPKGGWTIKVDDDLFKLATYLPGTTEYSSNSGKLYEPVNDNSGIGMSKFPIDETGLPSQAPMSRRGNVHKIQFKVLADKTKVNVDELPMFGFLYPPFGPPLPFKVKTRLVFGPQIQVLNTVYQGRGDQRGCSESKESVRGLKGTDVTYCFAVSNIGTTPLKQVYLTNDNLKIGPTQFTVPRLEPGHNITFAYTSTIEDNLTNEVVAAGTPIFDSNGLAIQGLPSVTDSDPSEVFMIELSPKISINNTVTRGHVEPSSCGDTEGAVGEKGQPVTYCFKVTNDGNTDLSNVVVTNPALDNYRNVIGELPRGTSKTVILKSTITESKENTATVTADTPKQGLDATISDEDDSGVKMLIDTMTRSGDKPDYRPPTCMQENWEDAGHRHELVCRAKEVYLDEIVQSTKGSCQEGEDITVNVMASIHYNTDRYDSGWYVAMDGGNAKTGICHVDGLRKSPHFDYKVQASKTDAKTIGYVSWDKDHFEGNDMCGDVFIDGGKGANIVVPFIVDKKLKCVDENGDGMMDFSACFSWRVPGRDNWCTLDRTDPGTKGFEADLYPDSTAKCFCARYDLPITVEKKTKVNPLSIC